MEYPLLFEILSENHALLVSLCCSGWSSFRTFYWFFLWSSISVSSALELNSLILSFFFFFFFWALNIWAGCGFSVCRSGIEHKQEWWKCAGPATRLPRISSLSICAHFLRSCIYSQISYFIRIKWLLVELVMYMDLLRKATGWKWSHICFLKICLNVLGCHLLRKVQSLEFPSWRSG